MKTILKHISFFATLIFIPAAITACGRIHADNTSNEMSAFEYKEVYLSESLGSKARALNLNSVDEDWGIWGHNLSVVVPENPLKSIYANVNGGMDRTQFCFMSNTLYDYIVTYIEDTDDGKSHAYAILPNDNNKVCQCTKCKAKGNTPTNASPAVTDMICKLAKRFPKHKFFTSHYITTHQLPDFDLPENVGVLVSAINLPITAAPTPQEEKFKVLLETWKQKTEHVYVWDYINNFDDYFTPYPIFLAMQHRLQLYQQAGVTGVFLNGSGYDYSTFSRIKAYALAQLLNDPNINYHDVILDICDSYYPVTGAAIEKYLYSVEDYVNSRNRVMPLYEGVQNSLNSYIPQEAFITFYNELNEVFPKTKGQEKRETETLISAMQYTMLEIKRIHCDTTGMLPMIESLSSLTKKGITAYSESGWTVEEVAKDFLYMYNIAKESKNNLLRGAKLTPLDELDEEYTDVSILTDGLIGLPSNYHSGHMIYSKHTLRFQIPAVQNMKKIRVCLARNKPYRILFPQKTSLTINGKPITDVHTITKTEHPRHLIVEFDFPELRGDEDIRVILERDDEERCMAVDEIEGY